VPPRAPGTYTQAQGPRTPAAPPPALPLGTGPGRSRAAPRGARPYRAPQAATSALPSWRDPALGVPLAPAARPCSGGRRRPPRRRPGRRRACSRPGARRPQHLNQRGLGGPRRGRGRVAPHDERRRGDHYALHPAPVQPKAHAPAPTRAGVAEPAAQRRLPTWPSMPGRCFRMPLQMRPAHDCDRRAARQRRHSGAAAPPQLTACDATQTCRWRGRTCRRAC